MAQLGSALEWGSRGRWFESSRPDQINRHNAGNTMFSYILRKIFGTKNDRELKKLWKYVGDVNQFWEGYQSLSDSELQAKTDEFRTRLKKGELRMIFFLKHLL